MPVSLGVFLSPAVSGGGTNGWNRMLNMSELGEYSHWRYKLLVELVQVVVDCRCYRSAEARTIPERRIWYAAQVNFLLLRVRQASSAVDSFKSVNLAR